MANIRKSFNFKTGLQVDNDNFVINSNGLVGIGTSVPQGYLFNVYGDSRVTGLVTTANLHAGVGTVTTLNATTSTLGVTSVTSLQVGSSPTVTNLIGYAYTAFETDNGGIGLHTTAKIGINTTISPGSSDSELNVYGNVNVTGIVTASSFSGDVSATDLTGTIDNARLPSNISISGIVTATTFDGDLSGNADTASGLTGTPNINVGIVTATKLIANTIEVPSTGITTISKLLHVGTSGTAFSALDSGRIGVGTAVPGSELQIRKASGSLIEVVSDSGEARISIGNSVDVGNSTGVLRFGSSAQDFDIINNDTGNINMYLHAGGSGIGTGRFDWIYGQTNSELMSLTYDGKLGIGKTNPDTNLHVVGTSTVTGNAWFGGNVTITGTLSAGTLTLPSLISANVSSTSGMSTFFDLNIINDLLVDADIGIGTTNPVVNLDARGRTALIGSIGINTETQATSSLQVVGQALFDSVGIGTTTTDGEGLYANGVSIVQHDATTTLYDSVLYIRDNGAIGVGTTAVRCQVDFGDAGKTAAEINPGEGTGARAYMLPPRLTNAQRVGLVTEAGAMIYNLDTNTFQGFDGTTWQDFH